MVPQAIRMADFCVREYKTRDPFEIIDRRKITLRWFRGSALLGYYRVSKREQYIGLNENADEGSLRTGAGHELGHSFLDYSSAANGVSFQDTMLYSLDNRRSERNANLFDAELLIDDESILRRLYYQDYLEMTKQIQEDMDKYKTERAKFDFEQEMLREFYDAHGDIPSYEELAYEHGVDEHLIAFKFYGLRSKGYELPNIPETRNDFLKHWTKDTDY